MAFTKLLALQLPGQILQVDLPSGRLQTVVEDAGAFPDGIVVADGVAYWTTMGAPKIDPDKSGEAALDFSERNGGVHAWSLQGGPQQDIVPLGAMTTGKQLTSDGAGTLYWADREGHRITRINIDGTGLTDLVVRPAEEGILGECVGVAVDRARGHLYWTQKGPAKGGQGRIFRAGLEIPAGESAYDRSDIEELWSGLPEPIDLHLEADWLYWTDRGAPPNGNSLNRAPVPGAGEHGKAPDILADGFHEAIGLAVDSEARLAYVSDLGGSIRIVPLPGNDSEAQHELVELRSQLTGLCGLDG